MVTTNRIIIFLMIVFGLGMSACAPADFAKQESELAPSPGPDPVPGACPGQMVDPDGCLEAVCEGGLENPHVVITWCKHPDANSNSLQKGDMHPDDPTRFWDWLSQGPGYSYTDFDVEVGKTYHYRAKHRPELPSTTIILPINECTCGPE